MIELQCAVIGINAALDRRLGDRPQQRRREWHHTSAVTPIASPVTTLTPRISADTRSSKSAIGVDPQTKCRSKINTERPEVIRAELAQAALGWLLSALLYG